MQRSRFWRSVKRSTRIPAVHLIDNTFTKLTRCTRYSAYEVNHSNDARFVTCKHCLRKLLGHYPRKQG